MFRARSSFVYPIDWIRLDPKRKDTCLQFVLPYVCAARELSLLVEPVKLSSGGSSQMGHETTLSLRTSRQHGRVGR